MSKQPHKQPTFVEGLIGSVVPLGIALAVGLVGAVLVYMFWFGAGAIVGWLF